MFKLIDSIVSILLSFLLCLLVGLNPWYRVLYLLPLFFVGIKLLGVLLVGFVSIFYKIGGEKEYKKRSFFAHITTMLVQKGLVALGGLKVKVNGLEKVPTDHRFCLVFNHTSIWDPILISTVLDKEPLIHISKPENFKIPIVGPFLMRENYLAFHRNDLKYNAKIILRGTKFLKEDRYSVGIAPEGTRNKKDVSKLLPFNEGVFKLPLKSQRDIVVVELNGTNQVKNNFPFKKTIVELNILKCLKYEDIKDKDSIEISNIVRNIIQNKIDSRSKEA